MASLLLDETAEETAADGDDGLDWKELLLLMELLRVLKVLDPTATEERVDAVSLNWDELLGELLLEEELEVLESTEEVLLGKWHQLML